MYYIYPKMLLFCLFCGFTSFAQAQNNDRPDIHDPDDEAWHRVYRSSEEPNSKKTFFERKKEKSNTSTTTAADNALVGFERVGCVCMDASMRRQTERGACGGHKGVRFWIYQRENGDTLMQATERHLLHPEAMPDDAPLTFGNSAVQPAPQHAFWDDAVYVALVLCAGGGIFFIIKKM
jgi:hypothetical protein